MLKFKTKDKLINRIMKNGKKGTSEKIFLNSVKLLQKSSIKQIRIMFKIMMFHIIPVFKLNILRIKKKKKKVEIKEIPVFLFSKRTRISLAVKMIADSTKKVDKTNIYCRKLAITLLNNSEINGDIITTKNNLQQKVIDNKKYLRNYRW